MVSAGDVYIHLLGLLPPTFAILWLQLQNVRISTSFADPDVLQPLLNCRLIALDKNPGVRPTGIGETSRQIIAKAVLQVVRQDVMDAAGCL